MFEELDIMFRNSAKTSCIVFDLQRILIQKMKMLEKKGQHPDTVSISNC